MIPQGRTIKQGQPLMVQCRDGWCWIEVHLSPWPMCSESVSYSNLSPNLWLDHYVHPGVWERIQQGKEREPGRSFKWRP